MKLSPRLIVLEVLALLVMAALGVAGVAAWRLSQGPVNIDMFRDGVERSLTEARGGRKVTIDTLALEWSPDRVRIQAAAGGVTAFGPKGEVVARADKAVITLDTAALFSGRIKTRSIRLQDGRAAISRKSDGAWTLADIEIAREPRDGKPFDPLHDLDWPSIAKPIRGLIAAGALESMEVANFALVLEDQATGTVWSAKPVSGNWSATRRGVELNLNLKLEGKGDANVVGLVLRADSAVTRAQAALTMEGMDPRTLARLFGYGGTAIVSGSAAKVSFSVAASEKSGLESAELRLDRAAGKVNIGDYPTDIAKLSFDAVFDPASKRINLASLEIASDRLTGKFRGGLDVARLSDPAAPAPFTISGQEVTLNLAPTFEGPIQIRSAQLEGAFQADQRKIAVHDFSATSGALTAEAKGEVWLAQEAALTAAHPTTEPATAEVSKPVEGATPADALKLGWKLDVVGKGPVPVAEVLRLWPVKLGEETRNWIKENIPAGKADALKFHLDWPPGAPISQDVLSLEFRAADATVRPLLDFPVMTGVAGAARLTGNSFVLNLSAGRLGDWVLDSGDVKVPRFRPKGELQVAVKAHGSLKGLMLAVESSQFAVGKKYGLDTAGMSGVGNLTVNVQRPLGSPTAPVTYSLTGGFTDAVAPNLWAGFGLARTNARFELDTKGMKIAGAGLFGPAQSVFDFRLVNGAPGADGKTELTATSQVTPDFLNAFGLPARTVMRGQAVVKLHATGAGREFDLLTANADLSQSAIDLPEVNWTKKLGAPGSAVVKYQRQGAQGANLAGEVRAEGVELVGAVDFDGVGAVRKAHVDRLFSQGGVDLRGDLSRRANGVYDLSVSGPYFDASPFMDGVLAMSGDQPPRLDRDPHQAPPPRLAVKLSTERMRVRPNADLRNARISLDLGPDGPERGVITGDISQGKTVEVLIDSAGAARTVSVRSDDAGFGAKVLLKADYLVGGSLKIDSRFENGHGSAQVSMADVRLKQAPLLAQVLSLASLRGLNDVLTGEGVLFTRVDAPLKLEGGRIELPGLRASGPAMGLTARGWVSPGPGELSLDGVLVPSFGVNSALGSIPLIGDLFVSRKGEGLFAPTYSVRGTFQRARVSINPVAAITPGVLRRIFENPEEAAGVDVAPAKPGNTAAPKPPSPTGAPAARRTN